MSKELNEVLESSAKHQKQTTDMVGKLVTAAQPNAVYSKPIISGEHTIINASESYVAMGIGYGFGGADEAKDALGQDKAQDQSHSAGEVGAGGGGGGGGVSVGRPVAVVSVGPDGVQVEPVVDVTKIALAFFTMFGSMIIMLGRMRRASKG